MISRVYITEAGQRLYAKWQLGTTPAFTRMQVGKGAIPSGTDPESVTALYDAVKYISLMEGSVSGATASLKADFTNEDITTAFDWKEIGVFATDPTDGEILYAYGYDTVAPTNIPAYATTAVRFTYNVELALGNATDIDVTIDPAAVYAKTFVNTATIGTTWAGNSAPYSQSISVEGMLATDTPIIDIVQTGTESTDETMRDAWANVTRIVASAGGITVYASEAIESSIPIQIKVVR